MNGKSVDIADIIERQSVNAFWLRVIIVSSFVTFFDGYDMQVIGFAAPLMGPALHLTRLALGDIITIGIFGNLVGGVLFGFLGDRIGRRPAIILATMGFSLFTLAIGLAHSYMQLLVLRLLDGIVIGGMLPVGWALNAEYAPRRARATVVTIIMLGYSLGSSLCGPVFVWLTPRYGWPALFFFGGACSLVVSAMLFFTLPESIRFLTTQNRRKNLIAKIACRLDPMLTVSGDAHFFLGDEPKDKRKFKFADLFEKELAVITPLLWLAYIVSSMVIFFKVSWAPIVLSDMGFTLKDAAVMASLSGVAGAIGGLCLMRFTDKRGAISIAAMPLVLIPLLLWATFGHFGTLAFMVLNTAIGFLIGGAHTGLTSIASIYYPSVFRANGAGWASSVGKIGSITGPYIGGWVLSSSLPARDTFALLAVCPFLMVIFVGALGLYHNGVLRRQASASAAAMPAQ